MKVPKHIIISGGGLRGFVSLGILKQIENKSNGHTLLEFLKLKKLSGTSIGSVLALGICLNMKCDDIFDILTDAYKRQIFKDGNISSLIHFYGFSNGVEMMDMFQNTIRKWFYDDIGESGSDSNEDPTFLDLYKKTKVKLNIVASEILSGEAVYFNYDTFPNMPIYVALKASVSIPLIFSPVIYENGVYCDGGVLDNSPHKDMTERSETMSICTDSFIDPIEFPSSVEKYLFRIITLSRCNAHHLNIELSQMDATNTIKMDCKNVNTLNLNMTYDDMKSLYEMGIQYRFHEDFLFFKSSPVPDTNDTSESEVSDLIDSIIERVITDVTNVYET